MALNHITIMGRLTRDVELRKAGEASVASFTVAVDRDFSKGEKETDFIECVAWRKTGEFVSKHFSKGSMIVVSGRLQIRKWQDKNSNDRKTAEIVADNCYFGDSKPSDGASQPQSGFQNNQQFQQGFQQPQNYGGYQPPMPPQYNQQGFGGYQQAGYPQQSYQAPPPPMGSYAQITDDDGQLPF
jgi:single-strand DNA-binding protein